MVTRGALWCGVANPEKKGLRPGVKNCRSGRCVKNVVRQTPVWRQLIISQTIHCHGNSAKRPPCHEFVQQRSAKCGVSVPNFSLLVMLCLVVVGECIGKVINFKWLGKNILPTLVIWSKRLNSSSRYLDQWHFCQLMQLSCHACLTSRQVQGTLTVLYCNHKFMSLADTTFMHSRRHVISTSHRWTNTC